MQIVENSIGVAKFPLKITADKVHLIPEELTNNNKFRSEYQKKTGIIDVINSPDQLIKCSDISLYDVKHKTKNSITAFNNN